MNIETALTTTQSDVLDLRVSNALEFLAKTQMLNGAFNTYVALDKNMEDQCYCYQNNSSFIATYILYSINFSSSKIVKNITDKALLFFMKEMKNPGLWRFFTSEKRVTYFESLVGDPIGIVPDLDDTACVSYALMTNNIPFDSNTNFFLTNRNEQGIFYTWLLNKSSWKDEKDTTVYIVPPKNDICCSVNANILLYLGENNDTKSVCDYLNGIVLNNEEENCNLYYPDKITFYYLLSRAYFNGAYSLEKSKELIISRIKSIQKDDGTFGDVLSTALAVCTMFNFADFNPNVSKAIEYIIHAQAENGSWQKIGFFLDAYRYYGSEELTTAICIEALIRYALSKTSP